MIMEIELLEKFLQGRCTEEEAGAVKAALDKDPTVGVYPEQGGGG
ncbi:MAG TPA: hypothetical protein VGN00_26310 [Puia sp.]|jgi:hypothetical protein